MGFAPAITDSAADQGPGALRAGGIRGPILMEPRIDVGVGPDTSPDIAARGGHVGSATRPKVLFASYSSDILGPTNSLLLLLQHLRIDHDVSVLLPGDGPFLQTLLEEGITVHRVPVMSARAIAGMIGIIRTARPDLVYLNSTSGAMRNVGIAAIVARVPYVCHVREMGGGKRWKRMWYLWLATAVIAVSRACGESVAKFVRPGRLHVVHNGVDFTRSSSTGEDRNYIREILGLDGRARVILSVAHVCQRKGQQYAVEAMTRVVRAVSDTHLCVVGKVDGDDEYVAGLRRQIDTFGLASHVHVLGYRSDTFRLYAGADLFLHSAVVDPHPRAVLEAMSAGLPVVAFATDGVNETVVHGVTGYLVEPRDPEGLASAATELLLDAHLCRQLGEAGRIRVTSQFSAQNAARQVRRIIDDVTARCRGSLRPGSEVQF